MLCEGSSPGGCGMGLRGEAEPCCAQPTALTKKSSLTPTEKAVAPEWRDNLWLPPISKSSCFSGSSLLSFCLSFSFKWVEGSLLDGKGYRGGMAAGAMVWGSGPSTHRHPPLCWGAGGCFSGISTAGKRAAPRLAFTAGWAVAAGGDLPVGLQGIMELVPWLTLAAAAELISGRI